MYKKITILGAGAVGSYLIWGLSNKSDIDLYIVAEGDREGLLIRAIRNGCRRI